MEEDDEWESGPPVGPVELPLEIRELVEREKRERAERGIVEVGTSVPWMKYLGAAAARGKKDMVPLKKLMDVSATSVIDVGAGFQMGMKFIAETDGDIFYDSVRLSLNSTDYSHERVIDILKKVMSKDTRAFMNGSSVHTTINGDYEGSPAFIEVNYNKEGRSHRRQIRNVDAVDVHIEIMSHPAALKKLMAYVATSFEREKLAQIKWWTKTGHGPQTREIYLPGDDTKLMPELYPDIADPSKYIDDYLKSDKSILLVAGPPGTGKTTLLRHMILGHKLNAHVIYDEDLMQNDTVFQSFLFDQEDEIMIIEDADTILSDRERDGNKLMSRFLNVSDGLIKLPNKKLVFTTNLTDFGRIDVALTRPGRCFGMIHTRPLNLTEAQAAAKAAGLPVPLEKREYTIAELFNQGQGAKLRGIGFVA